MYCFLMLSPLRDDSRAHGGMELAMAMAAQNYSTRVVVSTDLLNDKQSLQRLQSLPLFGIKTLNYLCSDAPSSSASAPNEATKVPLKTEKDTDFLPITYREMQELINTSKQCLIY